MNTRGSQDEIVIPRLFLRESGWTVRLKPGSEREFCHQMAPGQDFYHRLAAGEVYLVRGDEKLCIPCAARRGLFEARPRGLHTSPELLEAAGWQEGGAVDAAAVPPQVEADAEGLGWDLDLLDRLEPPPEGAGADPGAEDDPESPPWWRA